MRLAFASLLLLSLVAGCSNDPDVDDFVSSLQQARPELTDNDALCIVTELQQTYSDAELAALIDTGNERPDVESDEFAEAQFDAVRACELTGEVNAALVDAFASANSLNSAIALCAVTSLQEQFGFWELTDQLAESSLELRFQRRQFEAIFECGDRTAVAEQLEPQLIEQGVESSAASCVAEAIAATMAVEDLSVLYSGSMTDDFFALYFAALEECDALPAGS